VFGSEKWMAQRLSAAGGRAQCGKSRRGSRERSQGRSPWQERCEKLEYGLKVQARTFSITTSKIDCPGSGASLMAASFFTELLRIHRQFEVAFLLVGVISCAHPATTALNRAIIISGKY